MESLGRVAGQLANEAEAINDHGEVVGTTFGFGYQSIYVYRPGEGMSDLKQLLAEGSRDWSFINATAINNHGAIVGSGFTNGHLGMQHAFIAERVD